MDPGRREPWRADPLAAPGVLEHSPESAAVRQPRGQARLPGLAVLLAWAVQQRWAAVMVTAVERSAVADAAGGMHGFPAALTSFVGRGAVVAEIADQLGQYRLVTVTGPGGAGKTRLAGQVARQVADRLADGLARRQLLLVLDNCEHVIGAAAELCGRLLLGADDVRVLATSREALRIAG